MTDQGARRLMAEILRRAADDIRTGFEPIKAYRFLRGDWAGAMFEALDIDQADACRQLRDKAYAKHSEED
jgi:hypothetical protein